MSFVFFDKLLLSAKVDDLELADVDVSLLVGLSTLDFDDSVFASIVFFFFSLH